MSDILTNDGNVYVTYTSILHRRDNTLQTVSWQKINSIRKPESFHDANFVGTGGSGVEVI